MKYLEWSNSWRQEAHGGGWGEGTWGGRCLMGTEFQFGKMEEFWRWMVVKAARKVNVLNDTELWSLKKKG